jgi:hypothetical protein
MWCPSLKGRTQIKQLRERSLYFQLLGLRTMGILLPLGLCISFYSCSSQGSAVSMHEFALGGHLPQAANCHATGVSRANLSIKARFSSWGLIKEYIDRLLREVRRILEEVRQLKIVQSLHLSPILQLCSSCKERCTQVRRPSIHASTEITNDNLTNQKTIALRFSACAIKKRRTTNPADSTCWTDDWYRITLYKGAIYSNSELENKMKFNTRGLFARRGLPEDLV